MLVVSSIANESFTSVQAGTFFNVSALIMKVSSPSGNEMSRSVSLYEVITQLSSIGANSYTAPVSSLYSSTLANTSSRFSDVLFNVIFIHSFCVSRFFQAWFIIFRVHSSTLSLSDLILSFSASISTNVNSQARIVMSHNSHSSSASVMSTAIPYP